LSRWDRAQVQAIEAVVRRVVGAKLRRRARAGRRPEQEVDDAAQAVMLALFADGGALTAWDPARGLDLPAFASLVASREIDSLLRSRRRNPWTEDAVVDDVLDAAPAPGSGVETLAHAHRRLFAVAARLRTRVSPRAYAMFEMLYLDGRSPKQVAAAFHVGPAAVYAAKTRLDAALRQVAAELGDAPPVCGIGAEIAALSRRAP
jgi:RNA polymerase sigma-70 factor (ECF subfamily)